MKGNGFIKVYRKIRNTSVWCDSDKLKLWIYCLTEATHSPITILDENRKIELERGQFVTGRRKLENDFNRGVKSTKRVSGSTLFRWLELFEQCEMLHIKKTNKNSIITILNWDKYQSNEPKMNHVCTEDEPKMNHVCTQYKNDKNDKNDKNISLGINKSACARDIFALFESEFNRPLSSHELERISDWSNKHDDEKILLALRQAAIYNKLSFDYISRILENQEAESEGY